MNLPLYEKVRSEPPELGVNGHRGLWFERFFDQYDSSWKVLEEKKDTKGKREEEQGKTAWIKKVTEGCCGNGNELERHALRLAQRLQAIGGECRGFRTDWHFATGLGNPHPVKNGFLWHPTLGVPYLPGATVKGLVRAWVEQWDPSLSPEEKRIRCLTWFGSVTKSEVPEQAGELIFFDALPIEPPTLALDVITPHYGKWYEQGGEIQDPANEPEKVPADWHDPVPVPFLVVKKAEFLFAIAPRRKAFMGEVQPALDALEMALEWLGAGAKTAVGYGRMKPALDVKQRVDDLIREEQEKRRRREEELALRARLANLSPTAQYWEHRIRDAKLESDKNAFNQHVEDWLKSLEDDPQRDAIARLVEITRKHYKGLLENPEKTEGKKQKPAFSERQRSIARRLNALRGDST
ncbi:type III-B CRISPR module RAMP protein Cmr6 [Methylocaldum szegediense]|uniref:CRISPR-associated protein Cmr6 n=1 Tax=Methylocaldum szegediense TaxID=73780 RepID=A0ABN8XA52_9GAMM|nr:type III-B CRISPR module RAMP protein Cmr6 [Methylocaldum szegediense]CAI8970027.1 CRISPR-associated protein Cmr6 [Methylocaldum szegediense]